MHIYTATCTQNAKNTQYETEVAVTSLADLTHAARRDHIAAQMKDSHRAKDNFLQADCIMLDLDNTHSEDADEWKTLDDVVDTFPDVPFYYVKSRNYMKQKVKTQNGVNIFYAPREKFHFYFPLSKTYTSHDEYEAIMLKAAGLFPFFDLGAAKPAQFFFGVLGAEGGEEAGGTPLDEYIATTPKEDIEAAVKAYAAKVKAGTYTQSNDTEKAISRLYNYLGIRPSTGQSSAAASSSPTEAQTGTDIDLSLDIDLTERKRSLYWLRDFCQKHDIETYGYYEINTQAHPHAICIRVACPWEHEHSMKGAANESVIIVDAGGKLSYLCRHSHGWKYGWKEYRAFYEERDAGRADPEQSAADPKAEQVKETLQPVGQYIGIFKQHRESQKQNLRTGFKKLDIALGGGFGQELYIMGAETGTGKSAIASILAQNIAQAGTDVLYYALEMGRDEFIARGASAISAEAGGISNDTAIKYGEMLNDTYEPNTGQFYRRPFSQYEAHVAEYAKRYGEHLYIIEGGTEGTTAQGIAEAVRQFRKERGGGHVAVFVDYLQLLSADPEDKAAQRDIMMRMSTAVKVLKALASQEGATVFIISSMANDRKGKAVNDASFKYSGDIGFTGGVLLGWNWKGVTDTTKEEDKAQARETARQMGYREMVLEVLKQRSGDIYSKVELLYYPAYNYVVESSHGFQQTHSKGDVFEELRRNAAAYK